MTETKPVYDRLVDNTLPKGPLREVVKSRVIKASLGAVLFGDFGSVADEVERVQMELEEYVEVRYTEENWSWYDLYEGQ